jgi:transposase
MPPEGDYAVRHVASHVGWLSVGSGMLTGEMSRHTAFKFCLDPTVEQHEVLARHAGAARFAFNHCLATVKTALTQRKTDPDTQVPWTGFDLINAFNGWKKTEDAGRVFIVGGDGVADVVVTGLPWRSEVCQQVFEEAAVDCGRALAAWSDSRCGKRKGKRVGFPRFKKKTQRLTWPVGARPIKYQLSIPGPPSTEAGTPTPADGTALTSTLRVPVKTSPDDAGTHVHTAPAA